MKKILLMIYLFAVAVGYSQQTTVKANGVDNPVYYKQQQQPKTVVQPSPSESDVKILGVDNPALYSQQKNTKTGVQPKAAVSIGKSGIQSQEGNNPVFFKNQQKTSNTGSDFTYTGLSATDVGGTTHVIAPLEKSLFGSLDFSDSGATDEEEILADELYRANLPLGFNTSVVLGNRNPDADFIPTAGATETFMPAVGDHFFDPGGPGGGPTGGTPGNYPNCGCATQTTLAGVSEIEFQFFSVFATFDYLRIYDGTDATGTKLYDNSSGGANQGDITLAEMIASNGSATFTAASGNFFFYFHASSVVDYGGWDVLITAAGGGTGTACANPLLEVNQDVDDTCMATVGQGGLAQSYIAQEAEAAGAGIKFRDPSSGLNVTLSLWDGLPNAAGTMLATGTSQTDGTNWADVLWDPVVNVTVGNTYYIVIDGDASLPCISGSTNNPYAGGMTYANNYGPFPNFDYTFRTFSCDSGGGTGTACSQDNPSNSFENGFTTSKDGAQVIATDIIVPADTDFSLEKMTVNIWMNPGSTLTSADITFYDNAAGLPGTVRNSYPAVVPVSQTVIGNNFGFDISEVVFEISPEMLPGTAGSTTSYWVSFYVTVSAGSGYIDSTTATMQGAPQAYSADAGATWNVNPGWDTSYVFDGICEAIGGGTGNPCATTAPSNSFENGKSFTKNLGRIVANDITVAADEDMLLETININAFIGGVGAGVNAANVDIIIYQDSGTGSPGAVFDSQLNFIPTSQTIIGDNFGYQIWDVELDIADVNLPGQAGVPTTYWIGISLEPTDGTNTFWEFSSAGVVGNGLAYNDGSGFVMEPTNEGVYTFAGTCTPQGTSGGPCSTTAPSNNMENGKSFTKNLGRIVANDITIAADDDMVLETITFSAFIGGVGSGVNADNVDVIIYSDSGTGSPGAIHDGTNLSLVPTSQTVIGNNFGYDLWSVVLDVNINLPGQAGTPTTYWIGLSLEPTDGTNTFWEYSSAGVIGYGLGYNDGSGFVMEPTNEGVYTFAGTCTSSGGGSNDDCSGAIALSCGDSVTGETITATDSGGNPAPDVFYKYTGSGAAQLVTISLCGGGTDYDSVLRVYDNCNLANQIAMNDDFCGVQSEVTFVSDGTSTYYIMVEGFGSNSGNFSLDVTCTDPLPNDFCTGAIAMSCGQSVTGTTVGATIDSGAPTCGPSITSPGVWYSLDDNSGMPGEITFSLCDGSTNFDTKLSIYKGTCAALVCVAGNDDFCGLQSEVTITSDGNTKYYILVHSFGGATGTFTLDAICTPTPPPNDRIANSIYVSDIGFPYTDPAVAMPAATTEDGNPQGCDLTGANGVWYHFTSAGDGIAEATIITPGGASSVTFYSAPSLNAVETDLVLVPQNTNQCVPGTSASIYTLAGGIYYVFVLNSGAITDIVIDGTNLGVSNNTLEGFTYYPNPTNGVLNLSSKDNIEMVTIYNLLGQTVLTNNVGATSATLDISGLSVGTYMMKATVNGQVGVYKIVKK